MRSETMHRALALAVMVMASSFVPSPAHADVQGFMKIPGLPGESQSEAHVGEIELVSYTQAAGTKACFKAFVVKGLDKASPGLALLAVTNRVVSSVIITLSKAGDDPVDIFTAVLENVVVGTVELVEVDGGPVPTERVTLVPTRAILTYKQLDGTGQPGPSTTTTITCP